MEQKINYIKITDTIQLKLFNSVIDEIKTKGFDTKTLTLKLYEDVVDGHEGKGFNGVCNEHLLINLLVLGVPIYTSENKRYVVDKREGKFVLLEENKTPKESEEELLLPPREKNTKNFIVVTPDGKLKVETNTASVFGSNSHTISKVKTYKYRLDKNVENIFKEKKYEPRPEVLQHIQNKNQKSKEIDIDDTKSR